jgi:MFS family permease
VLLSGGFMISALGIHLHQIWLLWLGSGVIGGCGLGLGYISPVSTLIKWFPDRRGMATGLAIMGFGGGAMIGTPLADALMRRFATPASVGVWETFVVLGMIYFAAMMAGAFGYRLPPPGWTRTGDAVGTDWWGRRPLRSHHPVPFRPRQRGMENAAILAVVGGALPERQRRHRRARRRLADDPGDLQRPRDRVCRRGIRRLAQPVQYRRRIFWASLSDRLGRKTTYGVFFGLGMLLYASAPTAGAASLALFVAIFCVILTMYGGGFATIPAYLADLFGAGQVSAIHGRLLTAWSTAGVLGPVLVTTSASFRSDAGVRPSDAYTFTMYVLVGLLAIGFVCNFAVRPVSEALFTAGGPETVPREPLAIAGAPARVAVADVTVAHRIGGWLQPRGRSSVCRGMGRLQNADAGRANVLRRARRNCRRPLVAQAFRPADGRRGSPKGLRYFDSSPVLHELPPESPLDAQMPARDVVIER